MRRLITCLGEYVLGRMGRGLIVQTSMGVEVPLHPTLQSSEDGQSRAVVCQSWRQDVKGKRQGRMLADGIRDGMMQSKPACETVWIGNVMI